MKDALFGFTGFVGSNLARQHNFSAHYNSSNSSQSAGEDFDLIVFSAARAEKWLINQNPEDDWRHILALEELITGCSTKAFVLISTVDVFKQPKDVDEQTKIEVEDLHTYGKNRFHLEQHVRATHPNALIVRLPGLFGKGLKKNVIYDFLNDNNLNRVHSESSFQYYNIENLFSDITIALKAQLELVHFSSEPIRTGDIGKLILGRDFINSPADTQEIHYDVNSLHAEAFGGLPPYLYTAKSVMKELADFVAQELPSIR